MNKSTPIPTRLDKAELRRLATLKKELGLSRSELIRRACQYALPKFSSGEVDVLKLKPVEDPAA
jgi:hypothetical protein